MGVKALYYNCLDIGKHVKKSKRRFIWKFSIDGKEHMVDLVVSYLSGKKKVTHNGKLLYEGQKVLTSSFQFPFEIELNMCNICQKGEMYELRINNQAFTQLHEGGSRGGGSYEGVSRGSGSKSGYDNVNKRDEYGDKHNYEGYGSSKRDEYKQESKYDGFSSNKNSSAYEGHRVSMDSYKKPSESSSRARGGWEDVRQATRDVRSDNKPPKDSSESDTFEHGFGKFEYKTEKKASDFESYQPKRSSATVSSKPSGGATDFDNFGATSGSGKKTGFDDFATFDSFGTKSQAKPAANDFGGFGGFGDFEKPKAEPVKQSAPNTADLFGLDFSEPKPQTSQPNTQPGFNDFFGSTPAPGGNTNTGFGAQPTQQTQQTAPTGGSLFDLDFGGAPAQTTNVQPTQNAGFNQGGFDFMGSQPTTQSQPSNVAQGGFLQSQTSLPQTQSQPQPNAQQSKGDLWNSNLVSLNLNELDNAKSQPQQKYGNESSFDALGTGLGGFEGNMGGGFGNAGGFGTAPTTNNFGGMNNNFGGMGGMGGMNTMGGMGSMGGMGMNTNSGMGGMNAMGGMGGMNNMGGMGSMGGMGMNTNPGMGGMGMGGNNYTGGYGGNAGMGNMGFNTSPQVNFGMTGPQGFQAQQPTQPVATQDVKTPFDF